MIRTKLSILAVAAGAFTLLGNATVTQVAVAQNLPPQCAGFEQIRLEAQQRAVAVRKAVANKADRPRICTLVQRFYTAETSVVNFLEKNKTWCGIPDQAIAAAKSNHEQTLKFRTAACAEAPKPRPPSLSDAIGTPSVDTAKNTKTGRGTLDSLTGNPLAQ
jgi:hypothetical protein